MFKGWHKCQLKNNVAYSSTKPSDSFTMSNLEIITFLKRKKFTMLSGNKKKIATNIFWAFAGKIINMASALLVGILVARYLGPEQYGIMNYVISYVSIFTVISGFGLSNIEIRELSKNNDQRNYILGTCFD